MFQDFPDSDNFRKIIQDFQGGVRTLYINLVYSFYIYAQTLSSCSFCALDNI